MRGRHIIKRQIIESWNECIEQDYVPQRINSERSLQASVWGKLNNRLGPQRRLFIEPFLSFAEEGNRRTLYPDIVVCNTREIIAVIELKYAPKGYPNPAKDLRCFDSIFRNRDSLTVSNRRHRGNEADAREYRCSERILFVWASIHRGRKNKAETCASANVPSLEGCFLELHASTREHDDPEVYYYQ